MSHSTVRCACLHSMSDSRGKQQTNSKRSPTSSEDLLNSIDTNCRAWDRIRKCDECQGNLAQSIKLLQGLGPVVNELHILQGSLVANDASRSGNLAILNAQDEAEEARTSTEKSAVRLGLFTLDDPDDLKIVWTVILKHELSRIQNTLKSMRKHTQQKLDECRPSSVHISFVRNQAAEIDSLINDIQANVWRTLAKLDMGSFESS